jgi:hypothetical protein
MGVSRCLLTFCLTAYHPKVVTGIYGFLVGGSSLYQIDMISMITSSIFWRGNHFLLGSVHTFPQFKHTRILGGINVTNRKWSFHFDGYRIDSSSYY